MTGLLKTSHFSSEKRCKDKQKKAVYKFFLKPKIRKQSQ